MRAATLLLVLVVLFACSSRTANPPPLSSVEFQVVLAESRFASAEDGVKAFMTWLNDLEDKNVFPFKFNVKKDSGTAVIRTEDYWDTIVGTFEQQDCKIRHRGYLLGGDVGTGEIIFKCRNYMKDVVAAVDTDAASKYEKDMTTKVEQNLYAGGLNNNRFQRSTKITGLPLEIDPKTVDDLTEWFPSIPDVFGLDKNTPLYAAHQICFYVWDDMELQIGDVPVTALLQIQYASKTDCQSHDVIPVEIEFAWKIRREEGKDWDLETLQNSYAVIDYVGTSEWQHHEDFH